MKLEAYKSEPIEPRRTPAELARKILSFTVNESIALRNPGEEDLDFMNDAMNNINYARFNMPVSKPGIISFEASLVHRVKYSEELRNGLERVDPGIDYISTEDSGGKEKWYRLFYMYLHERGEFNVFRWRVIEKNDGQAAQWDRLVTNQFESMQRLLENESIYRNLLSALKKIARRKFPELDDPVEAEAYRILSEGEEPFGAPLQDEERKALAYGARFVGSLMRAAGALEEKVHEVKKELLANPEHDELTKYFLAPDKILPPPNNAYTREVANREAQALHDSRNHLAELQGLLIDLNKAIASPGNITYMTQAIYRMPAEWEKHEATLLAWPHHEEDWPGKFEPIPFVYGEIIRYLTQVERVKLLVQHNRGERSARDILKRIGVNLTQVDFHIIPTDRVWTRDSGPIFVKGGLGKKVMLDWRFNAWAKYDNHKRDDNIPARLGAFIKNKRIQPMHKGKRVVLEGGSIDVNGKGTLLTTEECLLSKVQERNPGFDRKDYEEVFANYLGIKKVIWLGNGITGDDTHGHVDDLARFVNPTTVVTVVEKNKRDKNYAALQDNLKRLKAARDQNGKKLNVIELPMPKPLFFEGTRLPASYANFYIANKLVLVPTFNDPADRVALRILAKCFPGREVVGIHAVDLVWGLGTIHCLSQQVPL